MAQEEQKKLVSRIKVKKKFWFKIIAPKSFGHRELGETYLTAPETAVGRKVSITLKEITGNVKDQNAYVHFAIVGAQGGKLMTSLLGYSLTPSYVRRAVKKNVDRLDDQMILSTKEGKKFVLKSLMVTVHKTKRSIRSMLRKQLQAGLQEEAGTMDFENLVSSVVFQKLQQSLRKKLSKVYPLRELAIRALLLQDIPETTTETVPEAPLP